MSENNKKYILITAALIVIGATLYFFLLDAYAAIYIYSDPRGCTAA